MRLLRPFSWLYGLVIRLRNRGFDQHPERIYQAKVPVISVGNLSTGGTGKTPMSEFLLDFISKKCGKHGAYLSRGYGRKSKGYFLVPNDGGDTAAYGDEARQVAHKFPQLPVAVCEDRSLGIQTLTREEGAEAIILDDAFQHRKVARDLDLVLLDAQRLPDEDELLPAGRLREPLKNLQRADALLITKLQDPHRIPNIRERFSGFNKPMAFCQPAFGNLHSFWGNEVPAFPPEEPLSVIAFAGLGNNAFFFKQLGDTGMKLLAKRSFPDHFHYQQQHLEKIVILYQEHIKKSANFGTLLILTTEKDFFRLKGEKWLNSFQSYPLHYLDIKLDWWEGLDDITQLVEQALLPKAGKDK